MKKALQLVTRLACWTAKQMNLTLDIIGDLTTDVDSLRHALLQDRAAIDFLLLAQGHGCEDFEGMCCMNLSNHSVSIHKKLRQLKDNMKKLTVVTSPWSDWLTSLGITGWSKEVLQGGIVIIVVIVIVVILLPCLVSCVRHSVQKSLQQIWLVQQQKEVYLGILKDQYDLIK